MSDLKPIDPAAPQLTAVVPRLPPPLQKSAGKPAQKLLGLGLALVLGGAIGYLGMKFGREMAAQSAGPKWTGVVTVVALPLLWFVVVGWHELGHVTGGWSGGGKFLLYVVGPFMWRRTPAGVGFTWNRNVNLMGGMAACLPLDPGLVTPRRLAVMIAGGPVASLVLAALAFGAATLLGDRPGTGWILARQLTLFTAVLSLLIFVGTAVPGTAGGFKTDGRRFLDLLRGDARSDQEMALIALTTAALAGVRPADYDPALVAKGVALRDGSLFDRYAHFTAFTHAADLGEFARAQEHLDYIVAGEGQLVPFVRDATRCEYAWLLATQTTDAGAARAWLDSAGPLAFDPATRLRAEAAVLLLEGRRPEAAARAREGLHALAHRSLSPVQNAFHAEALEELLRRAEAKGP